MRGRRAWRGTFFDLVEPRRDLVGPPGGAEFGAQLSDLAEARMRASSRRLRATINRTVGLRDSYAKVAAGA